MIIEKINKSAFLTGILLLKLLIFSTNSFTQVFDINGIVKDSITKEVLPFVNLRIDDGKTGTISDIDGKYKFLNQPKFEKCIISFVGYKTKEISFDDFINLKTIYLQPSVYELESFVVIAKENPANKIIEKVIQNSKLNNYENLNSFEYDIYDKMIFAPSFDSNAISKEITKPIDTTINNLDSLFEKSYLMIMETVSKRSYLKPDKNYNEVVATKVSGIKEPMFLFMLQSLQSTSFYKEPIEIMGNSYVNPISKGTFKRYYFEIQDTIIEPPPYDTTFIISFRPKINTSFDGLNGVLSVSSNNFAIKNIIANVNNKKGAFDVEIQQLYSLIDSSVWFPYQMNTQITVNPIGDSKKNKSLTIKASGKSYISNVKINPLIDSKKFGIVNTKINTNAYSIGDSSWTHYRLNELTEKEINTYRIIDSLGKKHKIDRNLRIIQALVSGKINIKFIDIHIANLLGYNKIEGLKLGLKLSTNSYLSDIYKLGGYVKYGIKDSKFKYGGNARFTFVPKYQSYISVSYDNNHKEAGSIRSLEDEALLSGAFIRELFIEREDIFKQYKLEVGTMISKTFSVFSSIKKINIEPHYNYSYIINQNESTSATTSIFNFDEASFGIKMAFNQKNLQFDNKLISISNYVPAIKFLYTIGQLNSVSNTNYHKFELLAFTQKKHKLIGTSKVQAEAGFIIGQLPYVQLFNSKSSYYNYFIISDNSFSTMRYDEFVSDKYFSLFLSHFFEKKLIKSKIFSPTPSIHFNAGFGFITDNENHRGIELKSYEKGFYEVGLRLNKILSTPFTSFGFGVYYRLGEYAFSDINKNFAFNFSLIF